MLALAGEVNPGWIVGGVVYTVLQMSFNAIVSIFIFRAKRSDDVVAKLSDKVDAGGVRVEGVKKEMQAKLDEERRTREELTERLVEERMRSITHDFRTHVAALSTTMDTVRLRLDRGDGQVQTLGDNDHKLQLNLLTGINDIKNYVVENAASKSDLKDHQRAMDGKVEDLREQLVETAKQLAVLCQQHTSQQRTGGRRSAGGDA